MLNIDTKLIPDIDVLNDENVFRNIVEALGIEWVSLKEFGVNAIPRGDATVAFAGMNTILKEHGIYIVPVGELECFIKEVGGHRLH
jgi:hypothetical protein